MGSGSGKIAKRRENTTTTQKLFTQAQTPVEYILPISVKLRQQLNINKSRTGPPLYIFSCIKIDNTLVFIDLGHRLIICNSDGTDIHHIPLSYTPWYITVVNENTVALTNLFHGKIWMMNISTVSVTSTIKTSDDCAAISYNDNNLYVAYHDRRIIHVMDLAGKVISTLPLPADPTIDITVDRHRMVCIGKTSIYCCSLGGKLIWKFQKDEFQDFRRVVTDDEGNVYVTCHYTHTVLVVSNDGQQYRAILTKSDGLNEPRGIYFDKKENILIVCNWSDGKVFLFDVKGNHHE